MNTTSSFLSVYGYLIVIVLAWFLAHLIKYIINIVNKEKTRFSSNLFRSGGMPSSHSAATVALATIIGLRQGYDSAIFGLASLFALIVMYDAVKVRRSSGEQGIAIQKLIKESNSKIKIPRAAQGHNPLEVMAGATLGALISLVVFLSTN